MVFLGKKEKRVGEETEGREKLSAGKKLKDLSPQNKKKRKEFEKPWGKVERIVVVLFIIFTAGVALLLTLRRTGVRVNFNFSLPKLNIQLFQEQTYTYRNGKPVENTK